MRIPTSSSAGKDFGFNLVGFATANLGHGVALRNTAAILERAGFDFDVLDLDPGGNRTGHDFSLRGRFIEAGRPMRFPVNLFHLDPPNILNLRRDLPELVPTRGRMNVSVVFWELSRLPPAWRPVLQTLDLVLAPTRFVGGLLDEALEGVPWLYYPQGFAVPEARPDRQRWGFRPDEVTFLFSFDITSGFKRKHPLAAVNAFHKAFPDGKGAALVLKVNNKGLDAAAAQVAAQLGRVIAQVPGVRILDESLPFPDLLSLYASADALVSLHRGEGLGLSLMEGMALGKPVLATAWSGNMDFMDESNSCLVPFTLVPPEPGTFYHTVSAGLDMRWAEPSEDAAALWMARLAASEPLRREIGEKARSSVTRFMAEAREGKVFGKVRDAYAGFAARQGPR